MKYVFVATKFYNDFILKMFHYVRFSQIESHILATITESAKSERSIKLTLSIDVITITNPLSITCIYRLLLTIHEQKYWNVEKNNSYHLTLKQILKRALWNGVSRYFTTIGGL